MNLYLIFSWLFVTALVDPGPEVAPVEQRRGPARLTLVVDGREPPTVRLSTLVHLRLKVVAPGPLDVLAGETVGPPGAWRIVEKKPAQGASDGKPWERTYVLLAAQPGEILLQPPELRYRQGEGEWVRVDRDPIPIRVVTRIEKLNQAMPRPITDIESLPANTTTFSIWPWFIAIFVATGSALWLIIWFARPPRPRRRASPVETAGRNLARVAGAHPKNAEDYQRIHFLLAKIVCRFVEAQWGVPALRRTTQEFLEHVQAVQSLPPEQQGRLSTILHQCDRAKFCPTPPEPPSFAAILQQAREFVEASRPPEVL